MPQDFLGQELLVGDVVAFLNNYNEEQTGMIESIKGGKFCSILSRGKLGLFIDIRKCSKIQKLTNPKIVFEVNRDLA